MPTSTDEFLRELEPLPYSQRRRRLAPIVTAMAADGVLDRILTELRDGDHYQRHLALMMALISQDAAAVRAGLADDDPQIHALAVRAALRSNWLTVPDLVELMADAPPLTRQLVYRTLAGVRRPDLADALVELVRNRYGEPEAARLLPSCGADTVQRLLPELDHAIPSWSRLVRRHRDVVLRHAEELLPGLDKAGLDRWWQHCGQQLLKGAATAPRQVLDLLDRFAPSTYLPGNLADYGVLTAADPHRMVRLLTAPGRAAWLCRNTLPTALLDRLSRLDPVNLVGLAGRLRDDEAAFARLLEALPPSRRGTLYDAAMAQVEVENLVSGDRLLTVLPHRWRHREARRILGLARIQDDEAATLRYTAHLPWPDAEPVLTAATRRASADDRGTGYELLLLAAKRSADPEAVAVAVERLLRLRNDQDPVRVRALLTLAELPRLLGSGSVETLDQIVVAAVEARDASAATRSALSRLAVAVLRHHPGRSALRDWSWRTLDRLFQLRGQPPLRELAAGLRRGQEQEFFATVRPWLAADMARGNYQSLFAVSWSLGRRGWRLPGLQDMLRQAISPDVIPRVFEQAVGRWLDDPSTRSERVAEVLRIDLSAMTIPEVEHVVASRRTDLLDLLLAGPVSPGRFLNAGQRWRPRYARYARRWLPRQQRAVVELLAGRAADPEAPVHDRALAVATAAWVPEHGRQLLARYVDSPDVPLAEAALGALPWTDRPAEALPILLARADGDRARVATYAASRAVQFAAPSRLPRLLGDIATRRGKVTSRKEAIRLLARFGGPEAMDLLLDAWQQPEQHRDVRTAIVSAARLRLDRPQCWEIVEQAVTGGREEVLALLGNPVRTTAAPDRPRYAALVVRACDHSDPVVARAAWGMLPDWAPWAPDLVGLVVTAVSQLDSERTWPTVANAITRLLDSQPDAPTATTSTRPAPATTTSPAAHSAAATVRRPLGAALAALVRLDGLDADPGGPSADRSARRRVEFLVENTIRWAEDAGPEADREPVREAARMLAGHPEFVPAAGLLLSHLARLDSAVPDDLAADLAEVVELVAERPALADRLAEGLAGRVRTGGDRWPGSTLLGAAGRLAGHGDLATGLFAVSLSRAGGRYGWSQPWRDLLHELRRHPVPDVRSTAFDVVMS
ncbi:hypothetical protein I0C86_13235 [Plantactinospora sp. S1510]|uniref:PBS lyase n=1 Tax=Plantactinospora alkalitolerans TaxID=2789879 RepID=A0ABS0GUN1_9ACTN|nr:hypothetical protein [Plantactinospora alkalitolerans]MBF9129918.1 hypothetical protein [Plantactinospora alkalitolerans]